MVQRRQRLGGRDQEGVEPGGFRSPSATFRQGPLANGYTEVDVSGTHAAAVVDLPPLHRNPFDRLLLAQTMVAGLAFLTADPVFAGYPGHILRV